GGLEWSSGEGWVCWEAVAHERFFPAAHTCVQLRDGVEKVYDRGRIYYRPDLATSAQALRVLQEPDGQVRYVASLMILGQALEDHLVLDARGEIMERPAVKRNWDIRGAAHFSDEWKA